MLTPPRPSHETDDDHRRAGVRPRRHGRARRVVGPLLTVVLVGTVVAVAPASARTDTGAATVERQAQELSGDELVAEDLDAAELAAVEVAAAALPVPRPPVAFTTGPESPSPYQGQKSCDPVEKPGATALRALLLATYGTANAGGAARSCSVGGTSEHKEGRAYDWMVNAGDASDKAKGDAFVAWLSGPDAQGVAGGNAHRLGIQYVIWNKRTWQSWTGSWKDYTGASPHTDHVHVSLSWDGAMKRTSWWTGKAVTQRDIGPCALYIGEPVPAYSGPNYGSCTAPGPRAYDVLVADFDGDGRDDLGTWSQGVFTVDIQGTKTRFGFGRAGDTPVVGDWDGDGRAGVGIVRNGRWHLRDTLSWGPISRVLAYGTAGDVPVVGKWDGKRTGIGVVRGNRWLLRSTVTGGTSTASTSFGRATDVPVAGDWDGDGDDSIGVFRTGAWHLAETAAGAGPVRSLRFGHDDGRPGVGDWDGDRRTTLGTASQTEFRYTDDPAGGGSRTTSVPF